MLTQETAYEVIETLYEQVLLSKEDIQALWGLEETEYGELQKLLLKPDSFMQPLSSTEGFEFRPNGDSSCDASQGDQICVLSQWEQQAIDRLVELLSRPQLEALSGPLHNVIRQVRRWREKIDRLANKQELASAIVIQRGLDLFYNQEIRSAVAAACQVACPRQWLAGKSAAIQFVQKVGFPAEFVGYPAGEKKQDFEYLAPRLNLHCLEPFQNEVKRDLSRVLRNSGDHAIISLPTGAGKTRVAVESVREWLTSRHENQPQQAGGAVLWLAHTEELCEQAFSCFRQVWESSTRVCPLHLIRFWGQYTKDLAKQKFDYQHFLSHPSVLISTPHRMARLLDVHADEVDSVVADLKRSVGVLIIDEAQRAAATSYRSIISEFKNAVQPVSVAGLTATPFRMEYVVDDPDGGTRELRDIFGKLIEPEITLGRNPRRRLQELGILAEPVTQDINTSMKIRFPNTANVGTATAEQNESVDRLLAKKTDFAQRRLAILDRIVPIASHDENSILYFGPSVNDAECMTYLLRSEGVAAAVISGKTRLGSRRRIVDEFKQGKIRVLCSCEVLTTGFDAPKVTHVVMARPTVSQVLYEQMLGRGLRGPKFGGTEKCIVLDCIDTYTCERPQLGYEAFRKVWEEDASRRRPSSNSLNRLEKLELALQEVYGEFQGMRPKRQEIPHSG